MKIEETTGVSEWKEQMTTTTTPFHGAEPAIARTPPDLRQSLGEQILLKLALDAVQAVDQSRLNLAAAGEQKLRPQMLLTLLTYCYAARIYGSREIERAARHDKTVRYICARQYPDWRALRHFRRHNRELLEQCLACVLKKTWILHVDPTHEDWAAFLCPGLKLEEQFAAAAREKVEVAIIMDTAEND